MNFLSRVINAIQAAFAHIFTDGAHTLAPRLEGEALAFAHDLIDHYTPNTQTAALAKSLVESGIENAQAHATQITDASDTIKATAYLAQANISHINPPTERFPAPVNGEHGD